MHGNSRVGIQISDSFLHGVLDSLVHLRCVAGLDVSARCFSRLDLQKLRPQFLIVAERRHHNRVSRRTFAMMRHSVVLLKEWMMNNSSCHGPDYESLRYPGQQSLFLVTEC